jgi:hypothetical protein
LSVHQDLEILLPHEATDDCDEVVFALAIGAHEHLLAPLLISVTRGEFVSIYSVWNIDEILESVALKLEEDLL